MFISVLRASMYGAQSTWFSNWYTLSMETSYPKQHSRPSDFGWGLVLNFRLNKVVLFGKNVLGGNIFFPFPPVYRPPCLNFFLKSSACHGSKLCRKSPYQSRHSKFTFESKTIARATHKGQVWLTERVWLKNVLHIWKGV